MRKISKVFLAFILTLFVFSPGKASADMGLMSEMVKKDARYFCSSGVREVGNSLIEEDSSLTEEDRGLTEEDGSLTKVQSQNSIFKQVIGTSSSGSKIVMTSSPFIQGSGYCHIFKLHMDKANGKDKNEVTIGGLKKSQFIYAWYPPSTMDIALEVLKKDLTLTPDGPNRFTKTAYSATADSKVKVVLHRGSDWGAGLTKYDYVIVSMYPVFK